MTVGDEGLCRAPSGGGQSTRLLVISRRGEKGSIEENAAVPPGVTPGGTGLYSATTRRGRGF